MLLSYQGRRGMGFTAAISVACREAHLAVIIGRFGTCFAVRLSWLVYRALRKQGCKLDRNSGTRPRTRHNIRGRLPGLRPPHPIPRV